MTMQLCGARSIAELDRSLIRHREQASAMPLQPPARH
jgi:isopentenyl diphosphate isomerase/L-lactate dehydrogenase-like FMN-dependent dehydrogenase